MTSQAPQRADEISFEQATERLEAIVDRIESGEATLEESLKAYEEGAQLLRRCKAILDGATQRVRELKVGELADAGADEPSEQKS